MVTFGATLFAMLLQISPGSVPTHRLVTGDGQKIVCKLTSEVYSRIPSRTCRTQREWTKIARDAEEDIRQSYGGMKGRDGTMIGPEGQIVPINPN